MTRREILNAIMDGTIDNKILVMFAQIELDKLDKEEARERARVSRIRQKNEPLIQEILSRFEDGEVYTSADFSEMELTTQKVVSLLTTLVNENKIVKTDKVKVEKRKLQGYKLIEEE